MKDKIVIYQPKDGEVVIDVKIEDETVWLSQAQLVDLFETTKQNISLHINNCFKEGELSAFSVVKESLTTASDGKKYKLKYYNLDVIISVGYRVKSQRGTQFRIWANKVLKDYLIQGYTINEKQLQAKSQQLEDLKKAVELQEAANLLYFIVKNHSFTDGNKRIAAFLFVHFLNQNRLLSTASGRPKISNEALVALTLMIAESHPEDKDMMVKVIVNLLIDKSVL